MASQWRGEGNRLVVITGGEPMLQLDDDLIAALKAEGFAIAVETNGTADRAAPASTGSASAPRPMRPWSRPRVRS